MTSTTTSSNDDGDSGKEPPEERDNSKDATSSTSKKTKKKQTSQKGGSHQSTSGGASSTGGTSSSTTKNGKRKKAANDEDENATASSETNRKKKRAKKEEESSSLKKSTAAKKAKQKSTAAAGASESAKKKGKKETAKEETAAAKKNKKRTATSTKAKKGADTTTGSSTSSTKKTTTTKRKRRRRSSDTDATAAAAEQQAQELLSLAAPPQPKPRVDPFPLAKNLLAEVEFTLLSVQQDLDTTKQLLEQYHPPTIQANKQQGGNANPANALLFLDDTPTANSKKAADTDTAGHSNTNHQVVVTGNARQDKLREYQRHYQQRQRILLPEGKGSDRWDKQKVPGQRRRRIHREADLPQAPPAPPPVGYSVFVGQMTTKIRHDRPDQHHNQPKVMQEIAKLWRDDMTEDDRNYYIQFANAAKTEYVRQQMEFRATSTYTPSQTFLRLGGPHGPWVPHNAAQRNALEREIAGYETYDFPLRPACMDEDYQWRDWRSKVNRKLKLRRLIVDYHDPQEQRIVAQAIDHAKATLMDAAGIALADVDHSAILAAATHECIVKLEELHKAVNRANDKMTTTAEQTQTTREEEADNVGEGMVEV